MCRIQSIFGLMSRQIIEPQALDVKFFHDYAYEYRVKIRAEILETREIRKKLAACRNLLERHRMNMELDCCYNNLDQLWSVYRSVTREAWRLDHIYHQNLESRVERVVLKKSA